jgi:DNA-binding transcriptional LysR family regulator
MDTFSRMQSFLDIVNSGGFSSAARMSGRSKALLSKHVSDLEAELGVRLLNRTTRQLSLTEAGKIYFEEANEILKRVHTLSEVVTDKAKGVQGYLRVSAPRSFVSGRIGQSLMAFAERHPDVYLDLLLDDRFVDLVAEEIDVAIRISSLGDSSLIARKLSSFSLVTCASSDFVSNYSVPDHPKDLESLPCIIDKNYKQRFLWHYIENEKEFSVQVKGRVVVNAPEAARLAALSNLGFARVPRLLVENDIANGKLIPVFKDFERDDTGIYAVYPHREFVPGKVRALIDHLVEDFKRP